MRTKTWYNIIEAKNGKPASITIEGEIGGWGITASQFRNDFKRIGESEAVNLHLVSGGGSIFEGNEIANIISGHKGEVNITLGSICASIATVIACAGKTVTAAKNTIFMIHRASAWMGGDAEDMRKTADVMEKLEDTIIAAYIAKTGKKEKELQDAMYAETWMNADEAKEFGFVDSVGDEDAEDEVLNHVDIAQYTNSAGFLAKAKEAGSTAAGKISLQDIANARNNPTNKPANSNNPPTPKTMTAEEIAAENKKKDDAIKAEALRLFNNRKTRDKEIRAITDKVKERDKKDFSELANEFLDGDGTVDEFRALLLGSDKFKDLSAPVVGSGVELIEPLDAMKGTPGFVFVNSAEFKATAEKFATKGRHNFSINLTAPSLIGVQNVQTSASPHQLTSIEYVPGISPLGVRQLRIKDLIMPGQTGATTVRYRREDAFANAAAAVAETGTLPELSVSVIEVDSPVKDIGGFLEMSENLLADYPAVASFINNRMPYMVHRATEDNLLLGDGTNDQLVGLLQTPGIQTQAVGADTVVDALHKALTKVRNVPNGVQANAGGGYEPDFYVMNPLDWEIIRLKKDNQGQYLAGGPFTGAYGNGAYANVYMIWGKPVVVTSAITSGTALCGAFMECSQYFQRSGIIIEMTNSHGTNFTKRVVTVRAAERLALTVPQPNGFCQVTGIA